MAVITGNPWEFTATTEGEGLDNGGVFDHEIFVRVIVITTGSTGGTVELLTKSGGISLTGPMVLAANDREIIPINGSVDGVYVQTLPSAAEVHVYHGEKA